METNKGNNNTKNTQLQTEIGTVGKNESQKKDTHTNNPKSNNIKEREKKTTNQKEENHDTTPQICTQKHTQALKIQKILIQHNTPPDHNMLEEKEIMQLTDIMLKIVTKPENKHTTTQTNKNTTDKTTYKCPACEYEGEKEHLLRRHRSMKPLCKTQWGKEKNEEWRCREQGCHKSSYTPQELQRRNTFYCREIPKIN